MTAFSLSIIQHQPLTAMRDHALKVSDLRQKEIWLQEIKESRGGDSILNVYKGLNGTYRIS